MKKLTPQEVSRYRLATDEKPTWSHDDAQLGALLRIAEAAERLAQTDERIASTLASLSRSTLKDSTVTQYIYALKRRVKKLERGGAA